MPIESVYGWKGKRKEACCQGSSGGGTTGCKDHRCLHEHERIVHLKASLVTMVPLPGGADLFGIQSRDGRNEAPPCSSKGSPEADRAASKT